MSDPSQISGTGPWLSFDLPNVFTDAGKTTAPGDAGLVYAVADKSGAAIDAIQATSGSRMKWLAGDGFVIQEGAAKQFLSIASLAFNPAAFGVCAIMEPLSAREGTDGSLNQDLKQIWGNATTSVGIHGDTGQMWLYDVSASAFRNIPLYVPTSRCCIIVTGNSSTITFRVNGQQYIYSGPVGGASATVAWTIGADPNGNYPVQGQWVDYVSKDHAFSANDIAILESYAQVTRGVVFTPTAVVVVDADSISYGPPNTLCKNWVRQIRTALPAGTLVYNLAQSGFLVATSATQIASRITPLVSASVPSLYILFAGTNDMALSGRTPAQVYADVQSCCAQVKAANPYCKVMVVPMVPRAGFTDATRLAFNALITNGLVLGNLAADAVADVATIPAGQPGMQVYTSLYTDGIHPSIGMSEELARLIGPKAATLLFGTTLTQLTTILSRIGTPVVSLAADMRVTRQVTVSP